MSSIATKGGKARTTHKASGRSSLPPEGGFRTEHHCELCGHDWKQRKRGKGKLPKRCPNCHAVRWWEKEE